jgi:peptidoglycan biosynthesis protein MviN/MurJ (putative lipid II flippase)
VTSRYRHQLLASAVGLGAAALCALLLMPDGGLTGMAISVSIGFIIAAALPVVQLWQHDGLHPFASPFGRVLGIVLIVSAVALIVAEGWLFLPLWLQLPLMLATMLAALWASCRFALPLDDRQALGKTGRALRLS